MPHNGGKRERERGNETGILCSVVISTLLSEVNAWCWLTQLFTHSKILILRDFLGPRRDHSSTKAAYGCIMWCIGSVLVRSLLSSWGPMPNGAGRYVRSRANANVFLPLLLPSNPISFFGLYFCQGLLKFPVLDLEKKKEK